MIYLIAQAVLASPFGIGVFRGWAERRDARDRAEWRANEAWLAAIRDTG